MKNQVRTAFSLVELLTVVALLGLVAAVLLSRASTAVDSGDAAACKAQVGELELHAQRWKRTTGGWPDSDPYELEGLADYYPEGLPVCPVDGTTYTFDSIGRVEGHNH